LGIPHHIVILKLATVKIWSSYLYCLVRDGCYISSHEHQFLSGKVFRF